MPYVNFVTCCHSQRIIVLHSIHSSHTSVTNGLMSIVVRCVKHETVFSLSIQYLILTPENGIQVTSVG